MLSSEHINSPPEGIKWTAMLNIIKVKTFMLVLYGSLFFFSSQGQSGSERLPQVCLATLIAL